MGRIAVQKNVGGIKGLCVITPAVQGNNRSCFMGIYSQRNMEEASNNIAFVQDNWFCSTRGVIPGIDFLEQLLQTKLVRAIKRSGFDVAADLRKNSENNVMWDCAELIDENKDRFVVTISTSEEITFINGCIDKAGLLKSAEAYGKSPYGQHLRAVAEGRVRY